MAISFAEDALAIVLAQLAGNARRRQFHELGERCVLARPRRIRSIRMAWRGWNLFP
jgi:hypothetical protein